jgi:hypothetical protein
VVRSDGYAASTLADVRISESGGGEPLRILLSSGATLSGRVRTQSGAVPGFLTLYLVADDSVQVVGIAEDGTFAFTGVTPATYDFSVGSARRSLVPREKITLEEGARVEREVIVPDLGEIVVDVIGEDGERIADASVRVCRRDDEEDEKIKMSTREDGHAVFDQLLPGVYDVAVSAQDHQPRTLVVDLAPGAQESRVVRLSR